MLPARGSPIVAFLEFIRRMLSRWFAARRKKIVKLKFEIPPAVVEECLKRLVDTIGFTSNGCWFVGLRGW